MPGEPDSDEAVAAWLADARLATDPFAAVYDASTRHREAHGCDTYASSDAWAVATIARAAGAQRILEIGCGLGYSALWLAYRGGPGVGVTTVEQDPEHVALARAEIGKTAHATQITILDGSSTEVLPRTADGSVDFAVFDGDLTTCLADLDELTRLVRPGGTLVSSNLFLGRYGVPIPGLENAGEYRRRLLENGQWSTAFLPGGKAISVRTPGL